MDRQTICVVISGPPAGHCKYTQSQHDEIMTWMKLQWNTLFSTLMIESLHTSKWKNYVRNLFINQSVKLHWRPPQAAEFITAIYHFLQSDLKGNTKYNIKGEVQCFQVRRSYEQWNRFFLLQSFLLFLLDINRSFYNVTLVWWRTKSTVPKFIVNMRLQHFEVDTGSGYLPKIQSV